MSDKPIEKILQEINTIIENNYSLEDQKNAKEVMSMVLGTLTLDIEQLSKFKQNLKQDNLINDDLKIYLIDLIDERIEFTQLENMSPAKRKVHEFMKIVNATDEQEKEMLENKFDVRGSKSKLKINNGPFGLLYHGKDENGNIGIALNIHRRKDSNQVVYISEAELETFFEKSNMDILSIFNEEINSRTFPESELKILYLIDRLRDDGIRFESEFYDLENFDIQIGMEEDQYLKLGAFSFEMGKEGKNPDYVEFKYGDEPGIVNEEVISEGKDNRLHSIYVDVNQSFPEIIKQVRVGEYHLKVNAKGQEKTSLQKKEEELSSLEVEARKISEAEALIDQQKEGQHIGE